MKSWVELKKKILVTLVIWAMVFGPLPAGAQTTPPPNNPPADNPSFTVPPQPSTPPPKGEIDPASYFKPPNQASSKKNEEALAKLRDEDRKNCELEAKGQKKNQTLGRAVAGAVTKPLKKVVNDKIGIEVLPETINQTFLGDSASNASHAIQNNLQTEFQEGFKTRWGEEFPKTLAKNLQSYNRLGYTADYLRQNQGQFKKLIDDSVRESLPNVLNRDFIGSSVSRSLEKGLRQSLESNLKLNLKKTAKPTIEQYYKVQIDGMLKEIPMMVEEQLKSIQDTIRGTMAGLESLKTQAAQCITDPLCFGGRIFAAGLTFNVHQDNTEDFIQGVIGSLFPELNQGILLIKNTAQQIEGVGEFIHWVSNLDPNKLLNDMIDGLSFKLEKAMTDPKHINRLTDAIMGAVQKPINQSIENAISKNIDAIVLPTDALINSIDTFDEVLLDPITTALDQQLNIAIATLTGPIQATIDGLGNSIASTIDNTLGATFYSLADGFTGTANEAGNAIAQGINNVGNNLWGAIYPPPPRPPEDLEIVSDDYANTNPLAENQISQSNYNVAIANGIRLTPGQNTIPQAGEMSYENYQSTFDDGGPVGGVTEGIAWEVAQTTQDSADQVATAAVGNQTAAGPLTSSIGQSLRGGFVNMIGAGAGSLVEGIPLVGPLLAPVVERMITAALGAAGVAPVAGGLPVMDVGVIWSSKGILSVDQGISRTSGKILSAEEQIKDLNEKLTFLQIQTCTNLKSLRRIQLLNEEKTLIWDADARKAQAAAINDYLEILRKELNAGVAMSPGATGVAGEGNGQSVVPADPKKFVAQRGNEARAIALNDLKTQGEENPDQYIFNQEIHETLLSEENKDPLQSDWTSKQEYDDFTSPGGFEKGGWDAWLKLIQPKNNPQGALNIARNNVDQAGAQAAAAAQAELDRGGGFLGVYDCPEEERVYFDTADSTTWYCRNYVTKTPPGLVRDVSSAGVNSPIHQLEQGNNSEFLKGEVTDPDKLPSRITDYRGYLEKDTVPSIFNGSDPCPTLGPCPGSGWQKSASSINLPPSLGGGFPLTDLPPRNNFQEPKTTVSDTGTSFSLGQLLPILINFTYHTASLAQINTASLAQINEGAPNIVGLEWNVLNADSCQARSDWLAGQSDTPAVNEGGSLPLADSRTLSYPIDLAVKVEKIQDNIITPQTVSLNFTQDKLTKKAEYHPALGALPGEKYRLTIGATHPEALEITVAAPTAPAGLIQLFKTQIEASQNLISPLADALKRHEFTYGTTDAMAYLSIKPKLNYILKCFKDQREAFKELKITRN